MLQNQVVSEASTHHILSRSLLQDDLPFSVLFTSNLESLHIRRNELRPSPRGLTVARDIRQDALPGARANYPLHTHGRREISNYSHPLRRYRGSRNVHVHLGQTHTSLAESNSVS